MTESSLLSLFQTSSTPKRSKYDIICEAIKGSGRSAKYAAYKAEWNRQNKDRVSISKRSRHYKRTYGISLAEYDAMLIEQGGTCKICRKTCATGKKLAVDHDHTTMKVRGLLCMNCNRALGHFQDSTEILETAIAYLNTYK